MPQESRLKKSLLNARVNIIFYFLSLMVSFFSRKIFLDHLGADFMGLTGTLTNLLSFLNLAELGIGSAIGYVLYKPLFEHNEKKINEIISVFGYLYRKIGLLILTCGLVLACFLPLIFPHNVFDLKVIYFAYFSFLASSLIGYFFNYKQTLLGADQRNYVVTAYFQSGVIIKSIAQIGIAYYTNSYYLWIGIELFFGLIYAFILNQKIRQTYPWLNAKIKDGKTLFKQYPEVIKYTKQIFIHKIGGFAQNQTASILIYAFVSLKTVAYYNNYTIILDKISLFLNNLLNSTDAGVGNLIAEGNQRHIQEIFWELLNIRYFIAGIISFCLFKLTTPFISLWLGEEYILPKIILLLLIFNSFISYTRGATDQFLFGYGLFHDTWAPIVETALNLTIAIIGGTLWGLPGILLGNSISLFIIIGIWKPYFLYHEGFKTSSMQYWKCSIRNIMIIVFSATICHYLLPYDFFSPESSFKNWIIYGLSITVIYTIISYSIFYILTSGMRSFTRKIIKRIF